jgi:hypothetical protein
MAKKKFGKKILGVVQKVAPTLATALGGPLAGNAVRAISEAILGQPDGTEEMIEAELAKGNPETLLKLKAAENAFKVQMRELDIEEDKLGYDDIDSARQRHVQVKDSEPAILSYIAIAVFVLLIAGAMIFADVVSSSQFMITIISTAVGAAISWVKQAFTFFLGSSKGSKLKDETIADVIHTAANR